MESEIINSSIRVNAKLWEDFKIWCIKHKTNISEKLDELIKGVLKNEHSRI